MDRIIALWCPSLLSEGERGEEARSFAGIVAATESFCPWVDVVRLGVCVLPSRGPSRFFGGEAAVVAKLAAAHEGSGVFVGAADGLFAAVLAARSRLIVPRGKTAEFLASWSVAVLARPELGVTLQRLGIHTLGQFAALPARHVLARFGADGAACQRVACGVEGELVGFRDPVADRRLKVVRGEATAAATPHQPGLFGGRSAADLRAASSFARVQDRLGVDEVLVGLLQGGRSPSDRTRLVPWGSRGTAGACSTHTGGAPRGRAVARRPGTRSGSRDTVGKGDPADPDPAPWPGRIPRPSPVRVLRTPAVVEVVDSTGCPVRVDGRGLLVNEPALLSVDGGPWQEIAAWAGPWPAIERWWSTRRRRARLQVVTRGGIATLLAAEGERWWMEGAYE
jgi:protein ImuB